LRKGKHSGNSILRAGFVGISLLFQVGWLLLLIIRLNEYSAWISLVSAVLSLLIVLHLYSKHTTSAMKMPWIMLILTFPVMGLCLYFLIIIFGDLGNTGKRLKEVRSLQVQHLKQDPSVLEKLFRADNGIGNQFRYLQNYAGAPVYENTEVTYYPQASQAFEAMKKDLEQAESFIFMEYFILSDTSAFREIREILERKVKAGVEVRLVYDDVGSVGYVNLTYAKQLNECGIQCRVFNPALPVLNSFLNHRDHRKITVVDGKVGFTGGYNLSDEYFGRAFPYGLWKDTGIRMEGEAVRSLTAAFLEMWNVNSRKAEDMRPYMEVCHRTPSEGFVQPYTDTPLDNEPVGENIYLQLLYGASDYVWITTPYLIIDEQMKQALCTAAKSGIDVRIMVPGIPDKKTIYETTKSYYKALLESGVKIYEYTPGFLHAKTFLCDDKYATVGSVNLDFRSLYLHFECGVWMYGTSSVKEIKNDYIRTMECCRQISIKDCKTGLLRELYRSILQILAPML